MTIPREQSIELEDAPCPLCGSAESLRLLSGWDNLYGIPGDFQLVRCWQCRHVYMNPRPTLATIRLCYPPVYSPHQTSQRPVPNDEPAEDARKTPWYLSSWVRRVPGLRRLYYWLNDKKSDYIPVVETSPKRALEIGCATGKFLIRLRNEGWEAMGVELIEEPAREAARQGFDVHVGTLESAAFPEVSFDAVFAWHVVEHLHEPKQTLQEIHRVLKPRGWFAFSVPNFASWERRFFGRCWHALELPRHLQHFTPRTLRMMLSDTGFDSVQIIHQRNSLTAIGSMGIVLRRRFPQGRLGARLVDFCDEPTMWWQMALAFPVHLLAFIRQGSVLTIVARRGNRSLFPETSSS